MGCTARRRGSTTVKLGHPLPPRNLNDTLRGMYRIIESNEALTARIQQWPADAPLMCDCEFVRERTYWPELGLLQLACGDDVALVDPKPLDEQCTPLRDLLQASLVVMHAPGEDLECLLQRFGWLPTQLFDTQLAAAYCGHGNGLGYRALVQQFCGIELDKGETRSDWLARPLSDSQLRYAAEDVLHLGAVYEALRDQLDQRGFRAWFDQDCKDALRRAEDSRRGVEVQLEAKSCYRMDALDIARWRKILAWREAEARERDRPKGWIVDNDTARQLAMSPAGQRAAHDRIFTAARRVAKTANEALWQELQDVEPNANDIRLADAGNQKQDRQQLKRLQDAVTREAESLDIPSGLLMSRKRLEYLIDYGSWPQEAGGWRRERLQPILLPLLSD